MIQIKCAYVDLVDLNKLKPHPRNANQHSEQQIELLAKIIHYQGWRAPIVVSNQSGFINKGHGRLLAAQYLGEKSVPVDYQDFESEEQEYLSMVSDNEIARLAEADMGMILEDVLKLGPDLDFDLLGIPDFKLPEDFEPQADEDDCGEPPKEPITKKGDVWIMGPHRLLCGDATISSDVQKLMGNERADMVWTDPPYNVAYEGKTKESLTIQNDEMGDEEFYKFLYDAYTNMIMYTKAGGAIYVAHADTEGINFRRAMIDAGWLLKQCLIWVKQTLVMGRQDYHWKHEPILYGWSPGSAHTWLGDRKQTTVLEFNKPHRNADHPTMKPMELIEYCLKNSCPEQGLVLDLFGGSGSTLIACQKLGMKARLLELDPKYVDVIVARWEKYTGQKAVLSTEDQNLATDAPATSDITPF